jgi:hypothetical protein
MSAADDDITWKGRLAEEPVCSEPVSGEVFPWFTGIQQGKPELFVLGATDQAEFLQTY